MSKGETMREIKFRGKDLKTKQWVYGYYSCGYREYSYRETEEYKHWIESWNGRSYFISEVDKNTVGQFTGLYDKNGKEIYEGDTVLSDFFTWEDECIVKFGAYHNEEQWENSRSGYGWYTEMLSGEPSSRRELDNVLLEVIGNIHEELAK